MKRKADLPRTPVAILGAGPIGLACALMLAQRGIDSELVDARSLEQARLDRRLLALSRGTVMLLSDMLGSGFAPLALIDDVHVSSAGELGAAHLSRRDFGGVALGATVWYSDLVAALAAATERDPRIKVRRPCRVTGLEQRSDAVRVSLDAGAAIEAALAVNAEGTAPAAGAPSALAILADVTIDQLACGCAVERFTRAGPLALLPVPFDRPGRADAPDTGRDVAAHGKRSMIWCLQRDAAQQRLALSDSEFLGEIQALLGSRLGRVRSIGPRSAFPLVLQRRAHLREHRLAYIGNAAQSLHPVAGQGFNLGMRDCACLADCLAASPADVPAALTRYSAARRIDRIAISTLTALLPRVFTPRSRPLGIARSAALLAIDLAPALRRELSSLLMFGLRN